MVKKLLILLLLCNSLVYAKSTYEQNCVKCHVKLPVSIDKYFYRYLLKYSSKTKVKKAMNTYLLNPNKNQTIMPDAFINRFGIKKRTTLSSEQLEEALEIYW